MDKDQRKMMRTQLMQGAQAMSDSEMAALAKAQSKWAAQYRPTPEQIAAQQGRLINAVFAPLVVEDAPTRPATLFGRLRAWLKGA